MTNYRIKDCMQTIRDLVTNEKADRNGGIFPSFERSVMQEAAAAARVIMRMEAPEEIAPIPSSDDERCTSHS